MAQPTFPIERLLAPPFAAMKPPERKRSCMAPRDVKKKVTDWIELIEMTLLRSSGCLEHNNTAASTDDFTTVPTLSPSIESHADDSSCPV